MTKHVQCPLIELLRKLHTLPKLIFETVKCNDHFSKFPCAAGVRMTKHVQCPLIELLRKLHTLPKLIFETVKVVVSHIIEFHTISRTCNRQLNRYTRPIFLTSTDAI